VTQPQYVPINSDKKVRRSDQIAVAYPVPDGWLPDRPAEVGTVDNPEGPYLGNPGPDQGYGLKLAKRFIDQLIVGPHEHVEDVVAGCLGTALKRAALFGRAPVIYDFRLAYALWGFLGDAPADLIAFRKPLFEAASHHYEDQRRITDAVPESTLQLTPEQVAAKIGEWRTLINTDTSD
jgi:alkanesulfonate monooxygenase SsuD/methylene tetrahydromethanopterin reductase-like flavin-dependent oxidoreductase (luciferase family)